MSGGIEPDTKDWTWVVERPCPECGFDASDLSITEIPAAVRANAEAWGPLLAGPEVRQRPAAHIWSPLEYACHVRDVFVLFDQRLHRMLDEDDPTFANWDQDATAVEGRYDEQHPTTVAAELVAAAERLSTSFAAVRPDQCRRTGTRSDGARFTVESFGRYLVHDPVHHLWDVTSGTP